MLSSEALRHAKRLQIRTRRLVDGIFAGQYHSVFKGHGIEFAEVREYVPGDDVRTIDWNVTARLGQPFVKRYVEERELTVMLLVDVSASGRFGSQARFKSEIAIEIAGLLALAATSNHDKVGLILFSDRIERFVPPQKGRNRALQVVHESLALTPEGVGTDLAGALDYLHRVVRRRAVTFILSDFQARGYETTLRIAHRRHDIVPICITDPCERALPAVGLLALADLETGRPILIDTGSRRVRDAYRAQAEARAIERRRLFAGLGLDVVEVATDEAWVPPLLRFFRRREQRLRAGR
jgi:uncharacterized protein (DUF58 family)